MSTHYDTLGVLETASDQDIKKAYKKLAMQHHPDKGGDASKFQKISEAYDSIKTQEKRQQYDQIRRFGPGPQMRRGQPFGFDIFDQFEEMFGGPAFNQRRPRRGNHTPYELLSLSDRERKLLNDKFSDKFYGVGIEAQKKLPLLKNGDHVRKLMMTVKEQIENKKKGFQAKWSKKVYQVLGKRALKRNRYVYRYQIGDPKRTYLRHELLLIPKKVDREVLMIPPTGSLRVQDFYTGQET